MIKYTLIFEKHKYALQITCNIQMFYLAYEWELNDYFNTNRLYLWLPNYINDSKWM